MGINSLKKSALDDKDLGARILWLDGQFGFNEGVAKKLTNAELTYIVTINTEEMDKLIPQLPNLDLLVIIYSSTPIDSKNLSIHKIIDKYSNGYLHKKPILVITPDINPKSKSSQNPIIRYVSTRVNQTEDYRILSEKTNVWFINPELPGQNRGKKIIEEIKNLLNEYSN